jgi:hypothetical protein
VHMHAYYYLCSFFFSFSRRTLAFAPVLRVPGCSRSCVGRVEEDVFVLIMSSGSITTLVLSDHHLLHSALFMS